MAGEGEGPSPPSHTIQCRRRLALMTFSRGSSESHRAFLRIRTPWPRSVASSADRCAERSGRHRCERLAAGSGRCGEPALGSLFLLPPHPAVFTPPHVPRMPLPRRTPSSCSPATGDGAFGRDAGFSGQRVHLTLPPTAAGGQAPGASGRPRGRLGVGCSSIKGVVTRGRRLPLGFGPPTQDVPMFQGSGVGGGEQAARATGSEDSWVRASLPPTHEWPDLPRHQPPSSWGFWDHEGRAWPPGPCCSVDREGTPAVPTQMTRPLTAPARAPPPGLSPRDAPPPHAGVSEGFRGRLDGPHLPGQTKARKLREQRGPDACSPGPV